MKPSDIRNHISQQCGFNKAKHRQDLQVKLSPERLAQLESICKHHPAKQGEKTQPQRLLESIIPNKADDSWITEPVTPNERRETGKCLHLSCPKCHGTGRIRKGHNAGQACVHMISCRCQRCSPGRWSSVQVCNAGDWPTVEDQERYWQERDEQDRIDLLMVRQQGEN